MKFVTLLSALCLFEVGFLVAASPDHTTTAPIQKRDKAIINPDYKKLQQEKTRGTTSTTMTAWIRTLSDRTELVTPTVIAGVTFNSKPPKTTDGLEPWVSIKKDGSPQTIKPKMKNGKIQNGSPTYGTWFATATTKVYTKEELKAHNMEDDQIHEEVQYIDEDPTDFELIPIMRCTPDKYAVEKHSLDDVSSEPFCYPRLEQSLHMDKTYFITWYSRFFDPSVEKVRIHLNYVKESIRFKGTKKRGLDSIDKGGKMDVNSFFVSDFVENKFGYYPLTVKKDWLMDEFHKKIVISIQPDNVPDEEFNPMDKYLVVEIAQGTKVAKQRPADIKKLEEKQRNRELGLELEGEIDYEKYMVMMTMPTCAIIAAFGMYLFVRINKKYTDLSHLKKRKPAGINTTHRRIPFLSKKKDQYTELPQYNGPKND